MPIMREGRGAASRATVTGAAFASIATAICGIRVTPMPAPTICTSVESELPSIMSRATEGDILQKDSA